MCHSLKALDLITSQNKFQELDTLQGYTVRKWYCHSGVYAEPQWPLPELEPRLLDTEFKQYSYHKAATI